MFDIGFPELILIAIVGLLVIGPERLPEALRTLGLWFGRMRRSFTSIKAEIEKEIGMDEVRRQLHNEGIMDEMKRIETEVRGSVEEAQASLDEGIRAADANSIAPPAESTESTDGIAETTGEPAAESAAEVNVEPAAEPAVGVTAEPAVEVTAEPAVEPAVQQTLESPPKVDLPGEKV